MLGISDLSVLALNSQINLQFIENDYSYGAIGGVVNFKSDNFRRKNGLTASINYNILNNIALAASGNFRKQIFHNFEARIQNNSNNYEYDAGSEVKSITNSASEIFNLNYNSAFVSGDNVVSFFLHIILVQEKYHLQDMKAILMHIRKMKALKPVSIFIKPLIRYT